MYLMWEELGRKADGVKGALWLMVETERRKKLKL